MFSFIKGTVAETEKNYITIENNGYIIIKPTVDLVTTSGDNITVSKSNTEAGIYSNINVSSTDNLYYLDKNYYYKMSASSYTTVGIYTNDLKGEHSQVQFIGNLPFMAKLVQYPISISTADITLPLDCTTSSTFYIPDNGYNFIFNKDIQEFDVYYTKNNIVDLLIRGITGDSSTYTNVSSYITNKGEGYYSFYFKGRK